MLTEQFLDFIFTELNRMYDSNETTISYKHVYYVLDALFQLQTTEDEYAKRIKEKINYKYIY